MSTYKTTGIAIKSFKLGEADRVVTFLTTGGKVDAVAKGVRRPKSKFGGRLEPGNDLDLVIAKGKSLDTVTGVQVRQVRHWIRSDLAKMELAFNILEMAEKFSRANSADPRLLALTAAALDKIRNETRLLILRLAFDIKVLAMAGFMPHLSDCVRCGTEAVGGFSAAEGGVVCRDCAPAGRLVPVSGQTLPLIRLLLRKRFIELEQVKISPEVIAAADRLIWAHIDYHVPAKFKTRSLSEKGITS